jgi:WD40 repeat protein
VTSILRGDNVSITKICLLWSLLISVVYGMEPQFPSLSPTIELALKDNQKIQFPRYLLHLSTDKSMLNIFSLVRPDITKETAEDAMKLLPLFITELGEKKETELGEHKDATQSIIDDYLKSKTYDQIRELYDFLISLKIEEPIIDRIIRQSAESITLLNFPDDPEKALRKENWAYRRYILDPFVSLHTMLEDLGDKVPFPDALPVPNIDNEAFKRAVDLLRIVTRITRYETVRALPLDDITAKNITEYFSTIRHLKEIHALIYTLNYLDAPPVLLSATLKEYIRRLKEGDPISIEQQIHDIEQTSVALPPELQIFIYKKCVQPVIAYIQALPVIYDVHEDKEWVIDVSDTQGRKIDFQHIFSDHTTTFHAQKNLLAAVGTHFSEPFDAAALTEQSSILFIFDINKRKKQQIDTKHGNTYPRVNIQSIHFSHNGRHIASRALDGIFIHALEESSAEPIKTIHRFEKLDPNCCTFSIDDKYLFVGYNDGLYAYDIKTGAQEILIKADPGSEYEHIKQIACHPSDNTVIVYSTEQRVKYAKLQLQPTIAFVPESMPFFSTLIQQDKILSIGFTPDGQYLVYAGYSSQPGLHCGWRSPNITDHTIHMRKFRNNDAFTNLSDNLKPLINWVLDKSDRSGTYVTLKLQNIDQPQCIEWHHVNSNDSELVSMPFIIHFDQPNPQYVDNLCKGYAAIYGNLLAHFLFVSGTSRKTDATQLRFTHYLKSTTYKDITANNRREKFITGMKPSVFFTQDGAKCFTFNCSQLPPWKGNVIYFFNVYRPHWQKLFPLLSDSKNFSLLDIHRICQTYHTLTQNNTEEIAALKKLSNIMPPAIQSTMQQCIAGLSFVEGVKHKITQSPHAALAYAKTAKNYLGSYLKEPAPEPTTELEPTLPAPIVAPEKLAEEAVAAEERGEEALPQPEGLGAQQPQEQPVPQIVPQDQPPVQPPTTLIRQGLRMVGFIISIPIRFVKWVASLFGY